MVNYNLFTPNNNNQDATIIFTHGIAEYSKSYTELALKLKEVGYSVITYDLKGHGKTTGSRGTINNYNELLNDLDFLVKEAYKKTKKVYLYGHSLGGVITNLYITEGNVVDGIIIAASPVMLSFPLKILKLLPKSLTNKIKVKTNFQDPNLAHDYLYQKDEYDLDYFYYQYINEVVVKGLKRLKKLNNKNVSALFIYSYGDKMTAVKNGEVLYKRTEAEDKTLLKYEKSRHNLHLDLEKERLFNDLVSWLSKH